MIGNDCSNITIISTEVGPFCSLSSFQENNKGKAGIYLVYRKNKIDQKLRLIYIGKAQDLSERVNNSHEHYKDWLTWAYEDENYLYFSSVIPQNIEDISRCEAALIYRFKPPVNTEGKESFGFNNTVIFFNGKDVCGKKMIFAL